MNRNLLVVGAGPKALAIHTKASVLRELGREAPNVIIIENDQVGANWSGRNGYTDGDGAVITPPEKDLGFPYRSKFGFQVDRCMAKYSWHSFQVSQGKLADWVDKERPRISHANLAEYLSWAAEQSGADIRRGQVTGQIQCANNEWVVPYHPSGQQHPVLIRASGLVITGPGKPRMLPGRQAIDLNVADSQTFWTREVLDRFREFPGGDIAVVGSGDTAASVIVTLLRILRKPNEANIHLFSSSGLIFSRGASLGEIRWSTNPENWDALAESARQRFLDRTERGVVSDVLKSRIDNAPNVQVRPGLVFHADMKGRHIRLTLNIGERSNPRLKALTERFRRLVVATGFKRYSFQDWFVEKEQFPEPEHRLPGYDNRKEYLIAQKIRSDMSFMNDAGWPKPKLYLPTLSGLTCGPGFQTLQCLGLLSDRIIESHLGNC